MAPTACTRSVKVCALAAAARGVDITPILAEHGIAPEVVHDPYGRIPHAAMCALWDEVPRRLGDPAFGLHAAEMAQAVSFDAVDYAAENAAVVRDALEVMRRYVPLLHDRSTARVEVGGTVGRWVQTFDADPPVPHHLVEFILARWVLRLRRGVGPDAPLREVGLPHAAPADRREHDRVFGLPLRFGVPAMYFEFDTALLDRPSPRSNPALGEVMRRHLEELARAVASVPDEPDLLGSARQIIIETLPNGPPTVGHVARKLGHSARSLQRRLKGERTTFQALLDDTRRELALRHLRDARLALTEVAFLTGFADATAFHHAFRRWTQSTPREFRRAMTS